MIDLTPLTSNANLLATIACEQDTLKIFEHSHYRWLTLGDEPVLQGVMNTSQPQQVCSPVNQAMLLFLLCSEPSTHILNLGLGSGCFERALQHRMDFALTTVEINPNVIAAAKQYFLLTENSHILTRCAEQFVADTNDYFDVVLIDIFSGQTPPAFFQRQGFWHDCRGRLAKHGKISINLVAQNEQQLIRLLTLLRGLFSDIIVVEFEHFKNIVLIVSNANLAAINSEQIKQHGEFNSPDLACEIKRLFHIT